MKQYTCRPRSQRTRRTACPHGESLQVTANPISDKKNGKKIEEQRTVIDALDLVGRVSLPSSESLSSHPVLHDEGGGSGVVRLREETSRELEGLGDG